VATFGGKTPLHRIQLRHIGFIKPKEFSIPAADDGEKFLLLPGAVFAHEDNHFLPVKRFGWRFGHVKFLPRLGRLHPGFHRHDTDGGSIGNAHEPGSGGKSVFLLSPVNEVGTNMSGPSEPIRKRVGDIFPLLRIQKPA
jgi:hypothetical protein